VRHRILTADDLPPAVLRAAVLAGDCYPVGSSWASVAEPDVPALRAAAFGAEVDDPRLVAAGTTAAWIWGALTAAPSPASASAGPGLRVRDVVGGVVVRELSLRPDDVVPLGGSAVTTPVRTLVDLLRSPGSFAPTTRRATAAMLAMYPDGTADAVRARVLRTPRAPGSRRALARLALLGADVCSGAGAAGGPACAGGADRAGVSPR
jgi:hypothetical protein